MTGADAEGLRTGRPSRRAACSSGSWGTDPEAAAVSRGTAGRRGARMSCMAQGMTKSHQTTAPIRLKITSQPDDDEQHDQAPTNAAPKDTSDWAHRLRPGGTGPPKPCTRPRSGRKCRGTFARVSAGGWRRSRARASCPAKKEVNSQGHRQVGPPK